MFFIQTKEFFLCYSKEFLHYSVDVKEIIWGFGIPWIFFLLIFWGIIVAVYLCG